MRSDEEMLSLILSFAEQDERIRAVTMEGSRANKEATHDKYCDFDICFIVTDIREFTGNREWIKAFGDILIVQYPTDWYSHPYDYSGKENYTFLIQFSDGNRIDLSLIDVSNLFHEKDNREPRLVLLNKDNREELIPVQSVETFYLKKPAEMEYYNTCNEFRWLSIYITKGLCRDELYYAKYAYDVLIMEMFIKMLNFKIGVLNNFMVTTGDKSKYLKRFLSKEEMKRFRGIFPDGTGRDIFTKLFLMYDYFAENARTVGKALSFPFDEEETVRVREFLMIRLSEWRGTESGL